MATAAYAKRSYEELSTAELIITLTDVEYKRDALLQKIYQLHETGHQAALNALTLIAADLVHELKYSRGESEALERIYRPNGR